MSARCQVELSRDKSALISFRGGGEKSWALEVREQTQPFRPGNAPKLILPQLRAAFWEDLPGLWMVT